MGGGHLALSPFKPPTEAAIQVSNIIFSQCKPFYRYQPIYIPILHSPHALLNILSVLIDGFNRKRISDSGLLHSTFITAPCPDLSVILWLQLGDVTAVIPRRGTTRLPYNDLPDEHGDEAQTEPSQMDIDVHGPRANHDFRRERCKHQPTQQQCRNQ